MAVTRALRQEEIIAAFGDPVPHLRGDGTPRASWELSILTSIPLPAPLPLAWNPAIQVSSIRCHRLVAQRMRAALEAIFNQPEAWSTVNDFGGCYAWRPVRGTKSVLSSHCWGIAVDLDVMDNPFGRDPQVHPEVRAAFEGEGFRWGGLFPQGRRDGMHFEFADLSKL